jgi:hypothetical protein
VCQRRLAGAALNPGHVPARLRLDREINPAERPKVGDDLVADRQTVGLVGDGRHHGASVASRWPIGQVHEVNLHLTPRTGDYSCGAVIAEVLAPEPLGRLLMVSHGPSWPWWSEVERELQALAVVRRTEELVVQDPTCWCAATTTTALSPTSR